MDIRCRARRKGLIELCFAQRQGWQILEVVQSRSGLAGKYRCCRGQYGPARIDTCRTRDWGRAFVDRDARPDCRRRIPPFLQRFLSDAFPWWSRLSRSLRSPSTTARSRSHPAHSRYGWLLPGRRHILCHWSPLRTTTLGGGASSRKDTRSAITLEPLRTIRTSTADARRWRKCAARRTGIREYQATRCRTAVSTASRTEKSRDGAGGT